MRRTQLDTSVLKTENSVSNPSGIPFPDGLETELSVSNFDFFCSEVRVMEFGVRLMDVIFSLCGHMMSLDWMGSWETRSRTGMCS